MSNTTTAKSTATRRPSAVTMKARLEAHSKALKAESAPKVIIEAYEALIEELGGKYSAPAKVEKKQAEKKPVAANAQPKAEKTAAPKAAKKSEAKAEKTEKAPVEKKVAPFSTNTTKRGLVAMATAPVPTTPEEFLEAVKAGTVSFSKVRENGSLRHWPVAAPGTKSGDQTAKVAKALSAEGATVSGVAKELGMSVPTVRRAVIAAKFSEEVFGMKAAEVKALAKALNS